MNADFLNADFLLLLSLYIPTLLLFCTWNSYFVWACEWEKYKKNCFQTISENIAKETAGTSPGNLQESDITEWKNI